MDDVSKIQQINNLARELMKHGQAKSMDQAISMAQAQVESGNIPQAPMPSAPSPTAPAPLEQVPQTIEAPAQGMGCDEKVSALQGVLDRQQSALSAVTGTINYHNKQFEEMNNKINGLIAEISSLKQAVERLQNSPVTPPLKHKAAESGQTQFKQDSPAPAEPKPAASSGHARTGQFKPEDVSVEKFFYYGQR